MDQSNELWLPGEADLRPISLGLPVAELRVAVRSGGYPAYPDAEVQERPAAPASQRWRVRARRYRSAVDAGRPRPIHDNHAMKTLAAGPTEHEAWLVLAKQINHDRFRYQDPLRLLAEPIRQELARRANSADLIQGEQDAIRP